MSAKHLKPKSFNISGRQDLVTAAVLVIAAVATVFRVIVAVCMPLVPCMAEIYDDALLVDYANNIVHGNWLGPYTMMTLLKRPGYALFLSISGVTGIPYQALFFGLHVAGCLLFVVAVRPLIESRVIRAVLYLAMLFLPILMAFEIYQRIYRMGIVIPFVEILFSSYIAIYLRRDKRVLELLPWAVAAATSLAFFYIIKEDSVWVFPFVVTVTLILVGYWLFCLLRKRITVVSIAVRMLLLALPVVATVALVGIIAQLNYERYGERTICERSDSAFSDFVSQMVAIDAQDSNYVNWVTRAAMKDAIAVSPTLQSIEPQIWEAWQRRGGDGEVNGDLSFWALLEAYDSTGMNTSGDTFSLFWGDVTDELKTAFDDGRLTRKQGLSISSGTQPIMKGDEKLLTRTSWNNLKMLLSLRLAHVSYDYGSGEIPDQLMAAEIVRGAISVKESDNQSQQDFAPPNKWAIDASSAMLQACKAAAFPICCIALVAGIYVLWLATLGHYAKARHTLLIAAGLGLSAIALLVAVTWFTMSLPGLEEWAAFMYCASFYPLSAMLMALLVGTATEDLYNRLEARKVKLSAPC